MDACLDRFGSLLRSIFSTVMYLFAQEYVIASLDDGSSLYKSHMPDFVSPLVSNDLIGIRG